jgi:hypothetical protein
MSIYQLSSISGKLSKRKLKRSLRRSSRQTQSTRANFALSQQFKRYPNSKTIVDLRLGNKTHTDLFPKGYDPFFYIKNPSFLPIKGEKPDHLVNHSDVNKVILSDTDVHKGVCLSLWSYNRATIERFKFHGMANIPKGLSWFHQCNSRTFQMFELWLPDTKVMTEVAKNIAKAMGLPLIVNLSKEYTAPREIEVRPFRPFDDDMHLFGEFNDR